MLVNRRIILALLTLIMLVACQPVETSQPVTEPTSVESVPEEPIATPTEAPPAPIAVSVYTGHLPASIDPLFASPVDTAAVDLIENIFVGLTRINPEANLIEPGLAREWQQVDDLTWHIFLRDDIIWVRTNPETGGAEQVRPVNAADVVFSMRRVCSSATQGAAATAAFMIKGCREVARQQPVVLTDDYLEQTLGVRVLNDVVVEFKLEAPSSNFLTALAMPALRPVPFDLIESAGEGWTLPEVIWTNGPYMLQPTIPEEEGYSLIASVFWPDPIEGNVAAVHVNTTLDSVRAYTAWQGSELALSVMPLDAALRMRFDETTDHFLLPCAITSFLTFSYDTSPFEKNGIRQAFSLAIDREALIDGIAVGAGSCFIGIPASVLTPPGTVGGSTYGEVGSTYDPDAANAAMEAEGHGGCAFMPEIVLLTDDTSDASAELTARYVAMWEENLNCTGHFRVEQADLYEVNTRLRVLADPRGEPRPGIMTLSWQADVYDVQHWLGDVLGCRNLFRESYLNQGRPCVEADEQLLSAASQRDIEAPETVYQQIQDAYFGPQGEVPVIPLYHRARPVAIQSWLEIGAQNGGPLRFDRWVVDREAMP